jgi:hypothetical protein
MMHVLEQILLFVALAVGAFVAIMALVVLALYLGARPRNERDQQGTGL